MMINLQHLFAKAGRRLSGVSYSHKRVASMRLSPAVRLTILFGARGVGKSTLLLQYLRDLGFNEEHLYVSLDDLFFMENRLYDVAESFFLQGGKVLLLDEVHKYPNWSVEVKTIYDDFPDLSMVLTGSSVLNLHSGNADLSRRARRIFLPELSYREYLLLFHDISLEATSLEQILEEPMQTSLVYLSSFKPLQYWQSYLKWGQYPFLKEDPETFPERLEATVRQILEVDIPSMHAIDYRSVVVLRKLLSTLGHSSPFKPNISKLAEYSGVSRETVMRYLGYLEEAGLIHLLHPESYGTGYMNKPEKLFIANTNLHHVLNISSVLDVGSQRETFFMQMMKAIGKEVKAPKKGDFVFEDGTVFEVGGANKSRGQLEGGEGVLVLDGIEMGQKGKVPLWLLGFVY